MTDVKRNFIRRELLEEIRRNHPSLESIIILEKDKILLEEYFAGTPKSLRLTASMEKSLIMATAAGILLYNELLPGVNVSLGEIFPEEIGQFNLERFSSVTLHHILTNSTGIGWPAPNGDCPVLTDISVLSGMKRAGAAGDVSIYKPDSFLIVWITEKLTGLTFEEFLESELFHPLGIADYRLTLYERTGPQLSMKSRDIIKIGSLYLARGLWEGNRIFHDSFTQAAHRIYYEPGFPESTGYGYLWWISRIGGDPAPFAAGKGGQYLCLNPERNMVFLITGCIEGHPNNGHRSLIRQYFDLEKIYELEGTPMKKTPLKLDKERKQAVIEKLISYIDDEWEQEIGLLKGELLLDFLIETIGAELYNKGVSDSRYFIIKKMEDMELDMDQLKV